MSLPYSNATSGQKAITDIQKILRAFDCSKFATGEDFITGEVFIQFEHRSHMVMLKVSAKNYAAAWLKENPYTSRKRCSRTAHEQKALKIGGIAIYSILRDWIKGQTTAIDIGMLTFESAFLSHIMLPNGQRVIEKIAEMKLLTQQESNND